MISRKIEISDIPCSNEYLELLLNEDIRWQFLDQYRFSDYMKDMNSPSLYCQAEGIVFLLDHSEPARLVVSYHRDLSKYTAWICYLNEDGDVHKMIEITSSLILK